MEVRFAGANQVQPLKKVAPQQQVKFTGAPKADVVSFTGVEQVASKFKIPGMQMLKNAVKFVGAQLGNLVKLIVGLPGKLVGLVQKL
ncbi:MAG: hypothetical protein AB1782_02650 [Cyanobacteriota bacterium]